MSTKRMTIPLIRLSFLHSQQVTLTIRHSTVQTSFHLLRYSRMHAGVRRRLVVMREVLIWWYTAQEEGEGREREKERAPRRDV